MDLAPRAGAGRKPGRSGPVRPAGLASGCGDACCERLLQPPGANALRGAGQTGISTARRPDPGSGV